MKSYFEDALKESNYSPVSQELEVSETELVQVWAMLKSILAALKGRYSQIQYYHKGKPELQYRLEKV